jgi:mevalonate kinase
MLMFMTSDRVTEYVWASYVVMQLSDIMDEIQQMTVEIDIIISRNGQKEFEATRFNDMLTLLEDLFGLTQESLQRAGNSHVGIEELLNIARETDIIPCEMISTFA